MSPSETDEFEVIDQLEASLSPEELSKIQLWLQPTDYQAPSSEFNRHLASQAPGTGIWVSETSKYQQWQRSHDHGSLWIKGVPGAGKSVTAASIIDHLQKHEGNPVLYFFFRYIISANRRPRSLIRDFLAQLLPYSARLQATLQPLLDTQLEDYSDERLWDFLLTSLSSMEQVYCVVDALDEMELQLNDGFLDRLNDLATFQPKNVKLLMTSRPKQYLQSSLRESSIVHINLEDDLVGKDISLFLSYRLKIFLPHDGQETLRQSLVSSISERSGGLFLYARLLLDQIIPSLGSTDIDIESLVKDLPVGLEEMYNSMLYQQAKNLKIDPRVQVFLLEWATHSSRALRLNELASVLASTFPSAMIPGVPKAIARAACAPLLEISEDETVQVIHHSFTEFLLNNDRINNDKGSHFPQFPVLTPEKIHKSLSIICLNYLRSGALKVDTSIVQKKNVTNNSAAVPFRWKGSSDPNRDGYDYQEAKLRNPFLEYAVSNWAFHASKYDIEDDEFFSLIQRFLDPNSIEFRKWLDIEWIRKESWTASDFQPPTPLHVAAFAGLTKYAERVLKGNVSVDPRDPEDRTPLHWACARGHIQMVMLLLKGGALPDAEDCRGVKPIHEAARKSFSEIVEMLLGAGVDPLTPKTQENVNRAVLCGEVSTIGETAIEYAYLQGHTATIMVLLPFITQETLEDLFCQCCRYGKFEAVQTIFKMSNLSANVSSNGATALYLACRAHNVDIVELLLANGANVRQTSQWRKTNRKACGSRVINEPLREPVHGVISGWNGTNNGACQQILRLLLNAGADIEAKDANGNTLLLDLFSISRAPDYVVIQSIVQMGANVQAVDKSGISVLQHCLRKTRDIKVLELLFEYGASADCLENGADTIMHIALRRGYDDPQVMSDVIHLLCEKGARCDVKNKQGTTALEYAVDSRCSVELLTMLLQSCSNTAILQRCLWKLKGRGKHREGVVEVIRTLLKYGASLEDRDSNGGTILLARTGYRWGALFDSLVECGADINAVDSKGEGVLHYYLSDTVPHDGAVQKFIDLVNKGLSPLQVDYEGNSLLHLLAETYLGDEAEQSILQKLLDYGIPVNSKNNQGSTPLHVYIENLNFNSNEEMYPAGFDGRFNEEIKLPLLEAFRRYNQNVDMNLPDTDGLTILHLAAQRSEGALLYLMKEGANPHLLTKKGQNALHLACRARQSNVVGYLCQTNAKALIYQRDSDGRTPLHYACTSGRPESVKLLLQAGADIAIVDNLDRTVLHACAESADEQRLWSLLARQNGQLPDDRLRPVPQRSKDDYDWPWKALKRADGTSSYESKINIKLILESLLAAGSDVLAMDSHRRTALDLAVEYDCPEMIQTLKFSMESVYEVMGLEKNDKMLSTMVALKTLPSSTLDPQSSTYQEISQNLLTYLPLLTLDDLERFSKSDQSIQELDGAKDTPIGASLLYAAATQGFTELIESSGPLARINDDPSTVLARLQGIPSKDKYITNVKYFAPTLHVACSRELPNMDVIQLLVERCGVDINARAVAKSSLGANIKKSVAGGTALHSLAKAKYWWQLDAVRYLHRLGAKINSINEKGETPLHIACTGAISEKANTTNKDFGLWRIECVKILLELGADVNILDSDGLSCLYKASSSPQIMRILLEHGADVSAGSTLSLFPAIQIQCLETITTLLDGGLSPNAIATCSKSDHFRLRYNISQEETRSALFSASFSCALAEHSVPIVKLFIERGADIYTKLGTKDTLIHYVFENAEFDIVRAYLDYASKIDFSDRDFKGRTIFLAACDSNESFRGHAPQRWEKPEKKTAPFLQILNLGADHLVIDNEGRNALHHLLDNPAMDEEAIIEFLANDAAKDLIHQKDGNGFAPLHCALRLLRPAVVEVLLSMGLDLLSPDPTGATALHHIAAQCLSVAGPSNPRGRSRGHGDSFYTGILALWKKYIALGGFINVRDNDGSPPLFSYLSTPKKMYYQDDRDHCCHLRKFPTYFSEEIVKDLDFLAKNNNGENALHIIARQAKSPERNLNHSSEVDHKVTIIPDHDKTIYHFFMRKGLNPLEEDADGRSSLDIAAACEQTGILELFQYSE